MDSLPDELRLVILSHVTPSDLWLNARYVNSQWREYVEDIIIKKHVPTFSIGLTFTLGSGSAHRWYDIRGTVLTSFNSINKVNPQYALFDFVESAIHPKNCHERVMQKWKQMCVRGFGPEQEWRVTFGGTGILMKLPSLVIAPNEGVWSDWREMLDEYYARLPEAWEGLARPI